MEYENAHAYERLRLEEQLKKTRIIFDELGDNPTLDVGCGSGISSSLFSEVMGIDPSKELLSHNPKPHMEGKAEDLPFKNKEFDQVIAVTSIHNFDDFEKGLLEIKRVGKKYGLSVIKRTKKFKEIDKFIKENFMVNKEIDEGIDMIYICS